MSEPAWEDVVDEYADGDDMGSPGRLAEWIAKYPHLADDLRDFTAAWVLTEAGFPPQTEEQARAELEADGVDVEAFVARSMARIREHLEVMPLHQPPRDLSAVHPVRGIDGRRIKE